MLIVVTGSQFGSLLGDPDLNADQLTAKLEETLPVIQAVSKQFKNPVRTKISSASSIREATWHAI